MSVIGVASFTLRGRSRALFGCIIELTATLDPDTRCYRSSSSLSCPYSPRCLSRLSLEFDGWYQGLGSHSLCDYRLEAPPLSFEQWVKMKPLSILQLDPADRAVLRIAGKCH
ncbi:hypothetical protein B4U80_01433 [Leptotrombidium deliense]|uniref:Uncharacterized protein n=1 Tax=Leptotrombidium deliense TaxID=299467 RepID=A0A443SNL6_9ACAR|nr:hypothetical protein B4U80_01433 [Leptotrombidium deliense]